jgi:hypothetical protein
MSARRRCAACGKSFRVRPQVPDQSYCSDAACQRERKKLWQRNRRNSDDDYRDNQARAQQAWLARNPNYWREYRARNPQYTEAGRPRQLSGAQDGRLESAAPSARNEVGDANVLSLPGGYYRMRVVQQDASAKMDASFVVELIPLRGDPDQ